MLTKSALRLTNDTAGCERPLGWIFTIVAIKGCVQGRLMVALLSLTFIRYADLCILCGGWRDIILKTD